MGRPCQAQRLRVATLAGERHRDPQHLIGRAADEVQETTFAAAQAVADAVLAAGE